MYFNINKHTIHVHTTIFQKPECIIRFKNVKFKPDNT